MIVTVKDANKWWASLTDEGKIEIVEELDDAKGYKKVEDTEE